MNPHFIIEPGDEGHSLLEATVALALLLALIVPAGGALAILLASQPATDYLEAATHVENALEDALARYASADSTWTALEGRIHLQRGARLEDGLIHFSVEARHASTGRPITALHTITLDPDR